MSKYNGFLPNNETQTAVWCKVESNSWNFDENGVDFKCRQAGSLEKKSYNIQKGVKNNNSSIYIFATNMPEDIKPDDKVLYLGKVWSVETCGYYLDQSKIVDFGIFDPEYIKAQSPKGITLV